MDYFKYKDDVSSIEFEEYEGEMKSGSDGVELVYEEIRRRISKITLINTEQTAKSKERGETYQFFDTHCIIFTFDEGYQLSLTKDDICELIAIYRGYDVLKDIDIDFLKMSLDAWYGSDLEGTSLVKCVDL